MAMADPAAPWRKGLDAGQAGRAEALPSLPAAPLEPLGTAPPAAAADGGLAGQLVLGCPLKWGSGEGLGSGNRLLSYPCPQGQALGNPGCWQGRLPDWAALGPRKRIRPVPVEMLFYCMRSQAASGGSFLTEYHACSLSKQAMFCTGQKTPR